MSQAYQERWAPFIEELSEGNLSTLPQDQRLGTELSFAPVVPALRMIREFLTALSQQDPTWEPSTLAGTINDSIRTIREAIARINTFSPTAEGAVHLREVILETIARQRDFFAKDVGPYIRGASAMDSAQLAALQADTSKAAYQIREMANEASIALSGIRAAAGEEGTSKLADFFAAQASGHLTSAQRMFKAAVAAAGLLLLTVAVFAGALDRWLPVTSQIAVPPTSDWIELTRQGLPRLFVLGVLAYGVRFFVRNYTVNKHLQVTNELRANILRTYPALIGSMEDSDKRGRIAILLAQAAVSGAEIGYISMPEDKGIENTALALAESLVRR